MLESSDRQPISRPRYIHEYKITSSSLYAAASTGMGVSDIVTFLNKLSKVVVPEDVQRGCLVDC